MKPRKLSLESHDDGAVGCVEYGTNRRVEVDDDRFGIANCGQGVVAFRTVVEDDDGAILLAGGVEVGLVEADDDLAHGVQAGRCGARCRGRGCRGSATWVRFRCVRCRGDWCFRDVQRAG